MSLFRQLFLPLLLLFSGLPAVAVPQLEKAVADHQSAADEELVVGVPRGGYPPFLYELPNQRYAGPLKELASRIAAEMGVSLRYVSYNSYVDARGALNRRQVDALIGVELDALELEGMNHIGYLGSYARAILMRHPDQRLTLEQARKLRWVCIRGFGSCNELARLGCLM